MTFPQKVKPIIKLLPFIITLLLGQLAFGKTEVVPPKVNFSLENGQWESINDYKNIKKLENPWNSAFTGERGHFFYSIRFSLPEFFQEKTSFLFISGVSGTFAVYAGDYLIYEKINLNPYSPELYYPYWFHIIPIPVNKLSTETIQINFYSQSVKIGTNQEILVSDSETELYRNVYLEDLSSLFAASIFFLLALYTIRQCIQKGENWKWIAGAFYLNCFFMTINFSFTKQLFFDHSIFWVYFQFVVTLFLSVCFFILMERAIDLFGVIRKIWIIQLIYTLFALLGSLTLPLHNTLLGFYLLIAIGIILAIFILVYWFIKDRSKINQLLIGGVFFLVVVFYDMLSQLQIITPPSLFSKPQGHWGALAFCYFLMKNIKKKKEEFKSL